MSARSSRSADSSARTGTRKPASRADTRSRKRPRWGRRILLTILILGVLGLIGLGIAYAVTPIPKPNDAALA
jgi:hypothetical protein